MLFNKKVKNQESSFLETEKENGDNLINFLKENKNERLNTETQKDFDRQIAECKKEFEDISKEIDGNLSDNEVKKFWRNQVEIINRRFRLFDGDKIFIVTTGMLKAGKSTFVNLIARNKNASPIGFGVDTTLRPALITMAKPDNKKGKIFVYSDCKITDVIDKIRGLSDAISLQPEEYELNEVNLRKYLCDLDENIGFKPGLIVVEVPYNKDSILADNDNKCVIFDMPGLDSANSIFANNEEEESSETKYKDIFSECDYLLFVQSSVSPLNEKASYYLKEFEEDRKECTYSLIQNEMNACYWRDQKKIEEDFIKQRIEGIKAFKKLVKPADSEIKLDWGAANLGQAYDAILSPDMLKDGSDEEQQKILLQSKYEELEKWLRKKIDNDGEKCHKEHSQDALRSDINNTVNEIKSKKCMIDDELKKNTEEQNQLNNKTSDVKAKEDHDRYARDFNSSTYTMNDVKEKLLRTTLVKTFTSLQEIKPYSKYFQGDDLYCTKHQFKSLWERFEKKACEDIEYFISDLSLNDISCNNGTALNLIQEKLKGEGIENVTLPSESDTKLGDLFKNSKIKRLKLKYPNFAGNDFKQLFHKKYITYEGSEDNPEFKEKTLAIAIGDVKEQIDNLFKKTGITGYSMIADRMADIVTSKIKESQEPIKSDLRHKEEEIKNFREINSNDRYQLDNAIIKLQKLNKKLGEIEYEKR